MKRLSALVLVLSLLLSMTGCSSGSTQPPVQPPVQPQQTTPPVRPPSTPAPSKPNSELPELLEDLDAPLTLAEDQAQAFLAWLDTQTVEYEFYGLLQPEQAMQTYREIIPYSSTECGLIRNGTLDQDGLRSRVLDNNKNYLAAYTGSKFSELSSADFDEIFESVCQGVEYLLETGCDAARMDEKLSDLKIFSSSENSAARMTHQETILAINLAVIEASQKNAPEIDYLKQVALHETMHLGQLCSDTERTAEGYEVNIGPCYGWENEQPRTMFWNWYIEGSAEWLAMDACQSSQPAAYAPYIKALESLAVTLIPAQESDAVAMQSLDPDLDRFFALFGAETDEERAEIVHMLWAVELALTQSSEFYQAYKAQRGSFEENKMYYHRELLASAGQTLTKVFYRQLCSLAQDGSSLQELFSLITVFETEMNRLVGYNNTWSEVEPFKAQYTAIQSTFFEQLAAASGMTADEVEGQFLAWYYSEASAALYAPGLTGEQQVWLQELMDDRAAFNMKKKAVCEFV